MKGSLTFCEVIDCFADALPELFKTLAQVQKCLGIEITVSLSCLDVPGVGIFGAKPPAGLEGNVMSRGLRQSLSALYDTCRRCSL